MASSRRHDIIAALQLSLFAGHALGQTISTSVTTIDAVSCDTPSCTVTPEAITSLTVQPSPTTVHVPGKLEPLVFSFDSVTLSSFQPDPTSLANDGSGTLTLGSITITAFPSASATQSYAVDGDESVTLTAAVTAAVQAEAQLYITEEIDSDSACALFPGLSRRDDDPSLSPLLWARNSRITGRRPALAKRAVNFQAISPAIETFVQAAIFDAQEMISSFIDYFKGVTADTVPGTQLGLFKWLPPTIPAAPGGGTGPGGTPVGGPTFTRMMQTAQVMFDFLTDVNAANEFVVTSLENNAALKASTCSGRTLGLTRGFSTAFSCNFPGYITICQQAVTALQDRVLINDKKPGPIARYCTEANRVKINADPTTNTGLNFEFKSGARAGLIIHEITHLVRFGMAAGWGLAPNSKGNFVNVYTNWNKDDGGKNANPEVYAHNLGDGKTNLALMVPPLLPAEQQIINANNWAFLFQDFYIRRECQWTTDGSPWPNLGNGP